MLRLVMVVAVVMVLFGVGDAHATKVNGKIVVTSKFRQQIADVANKTAGAKSKGYWNEPNGVKQVEPPRVDPSRDLGVVIFKEGAASPGPDDIATVKVRTGSLEKNVLMVRPGSTLKFKSVDPFDHELYSPTLDGFKPERQSRNAFRPIDFKSEGTYEVRCKLLPHFLGWIVVVPATYIAEVDSKGGFSLDEMEPGKYEVRIFHRGKWVLTQSFEITKEKEIQVLVKLDVKDNGAAKKKDVAGNASEGKEKEKTEKAK